MSDEMVIVDMEDLGESRGSYLSVYRLAGGRKVAAMVDVLLASKAVTGPVHYRMANDMMCLYNAGVSAKELRRFFTKKAEIKEGTWEIDMFDRLMGVFEGVFRGGEKTSEEAADPGDGEVAEPQAGGVGDDVARGPGCSGKDLHHGCRCRNDGRRSVGEDNDAAAAADAVVNNKGEKRQ